MSTMTTTTGFTKNLQKRIANALRTILVGLARVPRLLSNSDQYRSLPKADGHPWGSHIFVTA